MPDLVRYKAGAISPSLEQLEDMRQWLIGIQIICFLGALIIVSKYSNE